MWREVVSLRAILNKIVSSSACSSATFEQRSINTVFHNRHGHLQGQSPEQLVSTSYHIPATPGIHDSAAAAMAQGARPWPCHDDAACIAQC